MCGAWLRGPFGPARLARALRAGRSRSSLDLTRSGWKLPARQRPPCPSPSPSPALVQRRSPATRMTPATMTFASPVVPEPLCHPSRRGGRGGSGGGAWREARSAAGRAARSVAERSHPLTRRALSERSERSERSEWRERSELCGAPVLRAPQRSRRAARGDLPPERPRSTPRALPGGDTGRPVREGAQDASWGVAAGLVGTGPAAIAGDGKLRAGVLLPLRPNGSRALIRSLAKRGRENR